MLFGPADDQIEKVLVWQYLGFSHEGYFVEIGANDPVNGSQTWLLEKIGWSGVLVEPLPAKAELIRAQRPRSYLFVGAATDPAKVGELVLYVGEFDALSTTAKDPGRYDPAYAGEIRVPAKTMDHILEQAGAGKIDFLSLDTEGTELDVLRGLDLTRWQPRLILMEDVVIRLDKHRYLEQNGYRLVKRTTLNNWYVPKKQPFGMTGMWERIRLFRKIYLGLPFRKLRHWRHNRRAHSAKAITPS